MSFTVNNLKITAGAADQNGQTGSSRLPLGDKPMKDNEFIDETNYRGQGELRTGTTASSGSELLLVTLADGQADNKAKIATDATSFNASDLVISSNHSMSPDHKKTASVDGCKREFYQESERLADIDSERRCTSITPIDQLQLSKDQLAQFVSICVPKNKRVLCLIVRDKLSKLNQAKSYFYPTYYLFIQAIIDIDDHLSADGATRTASRVAGGDTTTSTDKISADNSFSASSSISADMMFIGSEICSSSQTTMPASKLLGNSYSDNELNNDTENEDDARQPAQTPDLIEKVSPESDFGTIENELIVYPDRDPLKRARNFTARSNDWNRVTAHETRQLDGPFDEIEEDELDDEDEDDRRQVAESHDRNRSRDLVCGIVNSSDQNSCDKIISHLFDNEKNPYTGTCGVVLSGRKRKKAKT